MSAAPVVSVGAGLVWPWERERGKKGGKLQLKHEDKEKRRIEKKKIEGLETFHLGLNTSLPVSSQAGS